MSESFIIQKSTLTEIGDAIRSKTGGSEPIPVTSLAEEIVNLPTGGDFTDATATASDIAKGKTAYVATGKVTGTAGASMQALVEGTLDTLNPEDFEQITKIRDYVFCGLSLKEKTHITLPVCTEIGNQSFKDVAIKGITAPELETIGNSAFYRTNYEELYGNSDLYLPKVKTIGDYAFYNYRGAAKQFNFPECERLGASVFSNNHSFSSMHNDSSERHYYFPKLKTAGGGCFGYQNRSLGDCKVYFDFPELTEVGNSCFRSIKHLAAINCNKLTKIPDTCFDSTTFYCDLPQFEEVVEIGVNAFQRATLFNTKVIFGEKVETVKNNIFGYCTTLTDLEIKSKKATFSSGSFTYITNLTNLTIYNIKQSITLSGSPYLTVDSLIHTIKELVDTGSSKTLTIGSTNINKLANTYVKLVEITDDMRAEDDLIDEKMPFVVCESTDEGAMLITDYPQLKNWILK